MNQWEEEFAANCFQETALERTGTEVFTVCNVLNQIPAKATTPSLTLGESHERLNGEQAMGSGFAVLGGKRAAGWSKPPWALQTHLQLLGALAEISLCCAHRKQGCAWQKWHTAGWFHRWVSQLT